ncbi:hypothetical protein [Staphylococcus capitis]|uniref:hypothetical protein n=4 Tax=Staphylococcus capitis TaxID=29388 RepID=UPI000D19FB90|nr:hypothetical protein [Staphylococcus capitis]PTG24639.1 hypothetical protein BU628_11330 [Staphylococcus capitis]PTG31245.1 hypothetical protein BU630_01320 [Staphylococcus capitis]PTG37192.1 hypothetical protein BU624_07550 [Staphylococcus capitis]PTG94477.1 hypothetical protein BU625_11650 [Staphylococcus capitis]PTH06173.1 hypothetical protein BU621_01240 [Staphylococcus capitis]
MIIGSQVAEHSFWYDHGVELFGAIVTLLAFLLTFTNIKRTDKRLEKDEKKRNIKTLKMIDLSTHKERMSIQQWALMFKMENDVITQKKYNILFSNYNVNFETENKKAFIIGEIANKYKISDLEVELTHYLEIIKDNLNNNHVNLSLQSLERITEKISYLNEAINYSKWFSDTEAIYNIIIADTRFPIESQREIEKLYKAYKKFNNLLADSSKGLID